MTQSRKFLFYTHALAGGGAERVWALLASEFARRGHDVTFAVDFEAQHNRDYIDPRIKTVQLPSGHIRAVLGLAKLIWHLKPDVSLSAIGVSNLKHMLAALMSGRNRRAVISYHGFFPSEPQRLSRWGNNLTPLFSRLCGRAVAVSDSLLNALRTQHGADQRRSLRIYNPVDFFDAPTHLSEADLLARPMQALFVGRFVPDKDILTLVRAFARVELPDARLLMVGDGPLRSEVEDEIARLGQQNRITLAGYVSNPAQAYRSSRVLVLSSIRESFGNVVAEALAHGLAVVSTDAAGPAEILGHGAHGAVVPVGDVDALAAAMTRALKAPGDPAPRMAHAQNFTISRATHAYLAMCEEVIGEA